jgi:3-oxoacyl-[acyl-carrier protein] reductase
MEVGNSGNYMPLERVKMVITGGAGDIGAASAEIVLQRGGSVVIADRNVEAGQATIDRFNAADLKQCKFIETDVTRQESVAQLMHDSNEFLEGINVVYANAGITNDRTFGKMTDEQWHKVISVDLDGVYYTLHEGLPYVRKEAEETGFARFLATSSVVGESGNVGQANYAAAKAGVLALIKTIAKEEGKNGINAMAVLPGFIRTNMTALMPEDRLAAMVKGIPLRRIGEPEDIAKVVAFLCSDDSQYMTGEAIKVNGGFNIG